MAQEETSLAKFIPNFVKIIQSLRSV